MADDRMEGRSDGMTIRLEARSDGRTIGSGFFCDFPRERIGEGEDGLLQVAVEGHSVPTPTVPFGEELFHIADGIGSQLGPARSIIEHVLDRLALMEENFFPLGSELDRGRHVSQRQRGADGRALAILGVREDLEWVRLPLRSESPV